MENTASKLSEQGISAFQSGNYKEAAELFQQVADTYKSEDKPLDAAEALNNLSVVLVKLKRPKEALEAVDGTEKLFEDAGDIKRQAMALGNKAAALAALGNTNEAIALYEESVKLFHKIGEDDLKTSALQAISDIKLLKGNFSGTALDTVDALISNPNPNFLQKILKFVFRRFAKL